MTASPLDSVHADEVARYLAERNSRVYSLKEVAEMTGFAERSLELKCRAGSIKHTREGRRRGLTMRQIELLVKSCETGGDDSEPIDEMAEARSMSRPAASRATRRNAA